jgi:dihydrofolate reductase
MIAIISAVAKNGVIGDKNNLPWYLPEDLKRFKDLTSGKTVLMGRKTFESIVTRLGKPLPNRTNIVITRDSSYIVPEGAVVQTDIRSALREHGQKDIFIIGGGEIYKQTIDLADTLYITHIDKDIEGDTKFPEIDESKWKLQDEEEHAGYSFAVYKKV